MNGYILHLFGESKQNSARILTNLNLTTLFLDINTRIIGSYYLRPEFKILNPEQFSLCENIFLD